MDQASSDCVAITSLDPSKTLGILHDLVYNAFQFILNLLDANLSNNPNERKVLSYLARIFYILGSLIPVTIGYHIFLKDFWKLNLNWDGIIPGNRQETRIKLIKDAQSVADCKFVSRLFPKEYKLINMHGVFRHQ